jgi:hypothetical protein
MVPDRTRNVRSTILAALVVIASCANAQEPPPATEPKPAIDTTTAPATSPDAAATDEPEQSRATQPNNTATQEVGVPAKEAPSEGPAPPPSEPPKVSPCEDQAELRKWIDKLHSNLYRFSCSSVSWFDGLFGSRPFDDEYRATHGLVTAGGQWSRHDGFDPTLRFRARVYFPQITDNFNAFIGRADRNDFMDDPKTEQFALPNQFSGVLDESVFVGLGFNEKMKKRGSFDFDAGVRLSSPIDPYVKGSYRLSRPFGESNLLRFRESLFWQKREGFGTTALVEWNHVFNPNDLLRWTNSGTFSENSIGMRWYSDLYLYHLVNAERAFAYEVYANGSTKQEVPLTTYGTAVIFRQRVWRKWLFLEVRTGLDWPRYFLAEERRLNPNAALSLEMRFGQE